MSMRFEFLDTSGQSRYCDETGGDYYDFLQVPSWGTGRIGVADVTGHGISAALLMATARALIACAAEKHEGRAALLDEVNRLLCRDTESSGHFMTLVIVKAQAGAAGKGGKT
jgi:sigma-B regulation protein RsbU (phosphoserine phosphatase)